MEMLTKEEVIKNAVEFDMGKKYVVYFLVKGDEIVYVGKTEFIGSRITVHSTNKDFDRFHYIEFSSKEEMDDMELEYIVKFDPKYNAQLPIKSKYRTIRDLSQNKTLGVEMRILKKVVRENGLEPVFRNEYYRVDEIAKGVQRYLEANPKTQLVFHAWGR